MVLQSTSEGRAMHTNTRLGLRKHWCKRDAENDACSHRASGPWRHPSMALLWLHTTRRRPTFDTRGFRGPVGSPQRGLTPADPCGCHNSDQVDGVRIQVPEQILVGRAQKLHHLDAALRAAPEGQAVGNHLAAAVLGGNRQPGDQNIRGASTRQTDLRSSQRDWGGGKGESV